MIEQLYFLLHILLAAFLAGIVGLERGQKNKPTGMRTHMIVGSASAMLIYLGRVLSQSYIGEPFNDTLRTDPIRIIEAIIVGVAFLGGGTILKMPNEARVANLSTAASLLYSAGIGIAVGLKLYIISVGVTILILLINLVLTRIEFILYKDKNLKHEDNIRHPDDTVEHN